MIRKLSVAFLAVAGLFSVATEVKAQDPFGFQFGYALGYQNSFRNRLPTPPYFAIYPPVYYGKRYARPYGDSPYAAFPQLRSSADYQPAPYGSAYRTRSISNPHVPIGSHSIPHSDAHGHRINNEPIAESNVEPKLKSSTGITVIANPYAQPQVAVIGAE